MRPSASGPGWLLQAKQSQSAALGLSVGHPSNADFDPPHQFYHRRKPMAICDSAQGPFYPSNKLTYSNALELVGCGEVSSYVGRPLVL